MIGRFRPNHATVVAYLALFVALGGSAYAAASIGSSQIKNNAILSRHIKSGQVKSSDLGANSVGGGKIINGSISNLDLGPSSVGTNNLVDGQVRSSDLGPLIIRTDTALSVTPGGAKTAFVRCHPGERPIAGGGETLQTSSIGLAIADSYPLVESVGGGPAVFDGWHIGYMNTSSNTLSFTPYVLCLAP